jgi:hypothetical protein
MKRSIYSEAQAMPTVEVTYIYCEGTWTARSADMRLQFDHGLAAGEDTYAKLRAAVEEIVPWSLEREDIEIEHYIEEASIPQYLAERETAERATAGATPAASAAKS